MGTKFGSGMNSSDYFYESLETELSILEFYDGDPGWKNSDPGC